MPPAPLLEGLPGTGIDPPEPTGKPMALIADDCVEQVRRTSKLGLVGELVAEANDAPVAFFHGLIEAGEPTLALRFLAYALPKRAGLWWAFRCSWDTLLDRDRTKAAQAQAANALEETAPPTVLQPDAQQASLPDTLAKALRDQEKAGEAALKSMHTQAAGFGAMIEALLAHAATEHAGVAPTSEGQAAEANAKALVDQQKTIITAPSRKPVVMQAPKPPDAAARRIAKKAEAAAQDKPMSDLQRALWMKRLQIRLQGFASCLQWILNPCQTHADAAGESAREIEKDIFSKTLAKATFWCGENMNPDPLKTKVPPPPLLPYKGIEAVVTKALDFPYTGWSRTDKLNWFLHRGVQVAEGKCHWEGSLQTFNTYADYLFKSMK